MSDAQNNMAAIVTAPAHETAAQLSKPHSAEEVVEHVDLPAVPVPAKSTLVRVTVGIVGGLAVLFVLGLAPRMVRANKLQAEAEELKARQARVEVVHPKATSPSKTITLPGSIRPLRETLVYARASGYVHQWLVDIGANVKEGQVLLELDTPELDQELLQARAALAQADTGVEQAKAHRELSRVTAERFEKLGPSGFASQQDLEEKRTQLTVDEANVRAAQAAVASAQANVNRLLKLKSFARVQAPYAGRITARNVEVGQLVTAGSAGGVGLFTLAHVDTVRVFLHVPQDLSAAVHEGSVVKVSVRELPGKVFDGTISHSAGALDEASRTLLAEVQLDNRKGLLLAGMYSQVSLTLTAEHSAVRLPTSALQHGAAGPQVAVVGPGHKLHFVSVQVGEDRGNEIDIVGGLSEGDWVIVNVPEGAQEGQQVQVAEPV